MSEELSKRLTPWEIEKAYRRAEKKIVGFLSSLGGVLPFVIAIVSASLMYFAATSSTMRLPFQMPYTSATARVSVHAIMIALLLSPLSLLASARLRVPVAIFVLVAMWLGIDLNFLFANFSGGNFAILLVTRPLTILCGYAYLRWSYGRTVKWPGTVCYAAVYLLSWIPLFVASSVDSYRVLVVYWALPTSALSLFIFVTAYRKDLSKDELPIALSPFNIIRGVFWPAGSRLSVDGERRELWWRGLCNFVIGSGCLILRGHVGYEEFAPGQHLLSSASLGYGAGILTDVAICNLLVGLARLHGFRVRDATNFVIFSATPSEYWMRVSVYNYIFVLQNVFMPLMRVSRSRFLTTFVSFAFFFFNRFGKNWSESMLVSPSSVTKPELIAGFARFIFWFLLLYLSRRAWIFNKSRFTRALPAWLSIIFTHASMILCSLLAIVVEGYLS